MTTAKSISFVQQVNRTKGYMTTGPYLYRRSDHAIVICIVNIFIVFRVKGELRSARIYECVFAYTLRQVNWLPQGNCIKSEFKLI